MGMDNEEAKVKKDEEVKKTTTRTGRTVKKEEKPVKKEKPKVLKPYIHIDTFLQTAIPLYGLSNVQASGFKSRMRGGHYQRDEEIFVNELKKYLNIK